MALAVLVGFGCSGKTVGEDDHADGGRPVAPSASGGTQVESGPEGGAGASGAAPTQTAGAGGTVSGADICTDLTRDSCVSGCLEELPLVDNAICIDGQWKCSANFVLASSCPPLACAVTPDACCDSTTGIVTANACESDGTRAACPEGQTPTAKWPHGTHCVPRSLAGQACWSLDGEPCAVPAVGCYDQDRAFVGCTCDGLDLPSSTGTWHCDLYAGP